MKDEQFITHIFYPYVEKGAINHLPIYNFYIWVVGKQAQAPMSGVTIKVEAAGSDEVEEQVIAASREQYGREYVEKIEERQQKAETKAEQPKAVNTPVKKATKTGKRKATQDTATTTKDQALGVLKI